jgi:membrane protein DedA with SNARE-associated domain
MPSFPDLLPLHEWIAAYGVVVVFAVVMMESAGVPMPGETALVTAAIYAGTTHRIGIAALLGAAAAAAIVGDNIGYWAGRSFGFNLLLRYGPYVHLTPPRLKMGQYLFLRHGGKIVFFGRFVAVLRTFAALLAGVNLYDWPRFLLFNALGGIVWALTFGLGGYFLGRTIENVTRPLALAGLAGAALALAAGALVFRRYEKRWTEEAERALPGPLAAR